MVMNNRIATERSIEEAVYQHALAPENYDVSAELGTFTDWLEGRSASARSAAEPGGQLPSRISRQLDLRVHDVALDEVELYAEVLSAVAASEGPLSHKELDAVLGVKPVSRSDP